jgi:hypothetical protein
MTRAGRYWGRPASRARRPRSGRAPPAGTVSTGATRRCDGGSPCRAAGRERATFGNLVRAEGIRRGADHVRQLTILGDGAAWIWNIATAKFPEATQIVDLYHAREHLHSLTRSLEFMLGDRRDEWLAARLEDLDYGDINGIEAAVREYRLEGIKKDEVGKELG